VKPVPVIGVAIIFVLAAAVLYFLVVLPLNAYNRRRQLDEAAAPRGRSRPPRSTTLLANRR
jgi:large-conductance mechanosensitive channel